MSISASPTPGPSRRPHGILSSSIYNYCQTEFDEDHIITQQDLAESDIIPNRDLNLLAGAIQDLVDQRLFKTHTTKDGATVWKIVAHDAAAKYKGLDQDQSIVYQCIEVAGRAGIWSKTIKMRTNMHAKRVESSLKFLMNQQYIKQCKSVKYPSRVMYILFTLQPSEDVTGGAFFTDGSLDASLVREVSWVLEMHIAQLTWYQMTVGSNDTFHATKGKGKTLMTKAEAETIRDTALKESDASLSSVKRRKTSSDNHRPRSSGSPEVLRSHSKTRWVPYPAGYTGYPTAAKLTNFVNENKVVDTYLPSSAVNQVLNILVYDNKLIRIKRPGKETEEMYKSRRTLQEITAEIQSGVEKEPEPSVLTEVPCGRCPVFDLCEEGGPVSANNCEYWVKWIRDMQF